MSGCAQLSTTPWMSTLLRTTKNTSRPSSRCLGRARTSRTRRPTKPKRFGKRSPSAIASEDQKRPLVQRLRRPVIAVPVFIVRLRHVGPLGGVAGEDALLLHLVEHLA